MPQLQILVKKWQFWAITSLAVLVLALAIISLISFLRAEPEMADQLATGEPLVQTSGDPTSIITPIITLSPAEGHAYTVVTISGEGWQPGENLSIFLENPNDPARKRQAVATGSADGEGRATIKFEYPDTSEWLGLSQVFVTVIGADNRIVSAAFMVIPATQGPTLTLTETSVTPVIDAPIVTISDLNLRQGPGIAYPVIKIIPAGTPLNILGQNDTGIWLLVRLPDQVEGWVVQVFINFQGTAPTVSTPAPPAPTATPLPAPIPITDWRGEYWSNRTLQDNPVLTRNDLAIDFSWAIDSPDPAIPADNFSARWSRTLHFDQGTYRFHLAMDDGARLWVDGQLLIEEWRDGLFREATGELALAAGAHNIVVVFYDNQGDARIRFWWGRINNPQYTDWKGEYWANRNFDGNPILIRNDLVINFDWGPGTSPVGGQTDNIAARWSRWADFQPGISRFEAQADDGLRLWVDGRQVISEWHDSDGRAIYTADLNLSGSHWLVVEYYNNQGDALARLNWHKRADQALTTPTATATTTPVVTPTPTETPTVGVSPTPTETPTVGVSPTPTETPTVGVSPTPTETPTVEASPTETPVIETTATPTETPTVEVSPTPTETPVIEVPPTETPTVETSPTPTETPTVEASPTETPTVEPTPVEIPTTEVSQPPVAAISGPDTAQVNQAVTFDASASQPGSAPIVSYSWNFADGTADDSGPVVNHTFSTANTYQVTLTVTDGNGLSSNAVRPVEVTNP